MTQINTTVKYLGIDISKDNFESYLEADKATRCWENTLSGITQCIKWINQQENKIIVLLEPSGGYERKALRKLYAEGIAVALVDASRVRHFAKSEGIKAKSDPIDARVLAAFGREKKPELWEPPREVYEQLRQRVQRRRQIADMITEEKNRREQAEGFALSDINATIKMLQRREKRMEKAIRQLISSDAELKELFVRLQQPKGVGAVTAYTMIAYMPELGTISDKRASSLAGLAPYTQTSGKYIGMTFTYGGRKEIRKPLHMAAKSAVKHNIILKPFYRSLIQRGKHKKEAITAVMRKIVVLMNKIAANKDFVLQS